MVIVSMKDNAARKGAEEHTVLTIPLEVDTNGLRLGCMALKSLLLLLLLLVLLHATKKAAPNIDMHQGRLRCTVPNRKQVVAR
jgi:hypothetical protein